MSKLRAFLIDELKLPSNLATSVASYYQLVGIDKEKYVVRENQYCNHLCMIESGYFRFYSHSDKKVITHWIFGEGKLITDITSINLREPAKWNI